MYVYSDLQDPTAQFACQGYCSQGHYAQRKSPREIETIGSACLRLGIVDHVVMAHIYVQRANDTSRRSEKVIQLTVRARSVSLLASWDSQRTSIDRIREGLPFQSRFRGGCYVLGRVFQLKMGRIDLKGHA